MRFRRVLSFAAIVAIATTARALTPDEILIVGNGNSQVSKDVAAFYAAQRHVPADQLVLLDLDSREEISRADYVTKIETPVRDYLQQHDPGGHIKCLLTLIGTPIRIANRTITPEQKAELDKIHQAGTPAEAAALQETKQVEALAVKLDPTYKPPTDLPVLQAVAIRADTAVAHIVQVLERQPDPAKRRAILEQLFVTLDSLLGPSGKLQRVMFRDLPIPVAAPAIATTTPTTGPAAAPRMVDESKVPANQVSPERAAILAEAKQRVEDATNRLQLLTAKKDDPAARAELRDLARTQLGTLLYARVLESQAEQLESNETTASVDNELALVKWEDQYPLPRWLENPLYYRNAQRMKNTPPVMMVMRLDGPQDTTPRDIIVSSLRAEQTGLDGPIVIDARGLPTIKADGSPDLYGQYDELLRNLATMVKAHSRIPVVLDDQQAVLPPGSVKDVALYCGWYAVRNYIPSCTFKPGAVGFHVASYEMLSLKSAGERGWVAGLLNDGIAATLGAVNEPYLHSFPHPDEFFPLLMTGKLTLAEVYWRTNPLVSWQISMIGDPLYRPFMAHPAMQPRDLPLALQSALRSQDDGAEPVGLPGDKK